MIVHTAQCRPAVVIADDPIPSLQPSSRPSGRRPLVQKTVGETLSDCTPSPRPCTVILAVPPPWRCRSVKSPVTALDCPPRLSGRSPSGPPPPRRRTTIFITSDAVEFFSQSAPATVLRNHPGTFHEWRIVAHVLIMAAFQLRHPVTFFIQMKSSDPSLHCRHATPAHPAPTAPRGAV